jgi:hypothetical protein
MSLLLESGEVAFTGYDSFRVWSSNDKNLIPLLHVNTTFGISAVDRHNTTGLVLDQETVLATVPTNASFVIGHVIINGIKRSIGGDQLLFVRAETMQNAPAYYASTGTGVTAFASTIWYNVFISGTQLKVRVSYRFPSASRSIYGGATAKVSATIGGFEF